MGNLCDKEERPSKIHSSVCLNTINNEIQLASEPQQMDTKTNSQNYYTAQVGKQQKKQIGLEDFIMIGTVGKGAFGKVYKVKKRDNNKLYAMKQIPKKKIFEHKLENNTLLERNVLKSSKHPFIVQLKYSFQTPTKLYFVMEYISGGEFYKILQQTEGLPEHVVKFMTAEVVLALEYLNTQIKIIYRDLKPENMLLTTSGHVKLTDFGLATIRKDAGEKTNTMAGTPEYLAPEIIQRQGHQFEVDLWTLGILIYEMINGSPPFHHPERNEMKIRQLIINNKPTYPNQMSNEAKDLISKLLKSDPQERLGSNGYQEIKEHPFFNGINWEDLLALKLKSPLKSFAEQSSKKNMESRFKAKDGQIVESPQLSANIKHIEGITYNGNEGETFNSNKKMHIQQS